MLLCSMSATLHREDHIDSSRTHCFQLFTTFTSEIFLWVFNGSSQTQSEHSILGTSWDGAHQVMMRLQRANAAFWLKVLSPQTFSKKTTQKEQISSSWIIISFPTFMTTMVNPICSTSNFGRFNSIHLYRTGYRCIQSDIVIPLQFWDGCWILTPYPVGAQVLGGQAKKENHKSPGRLSRCFVFNVE